MKKIIAAIAVVTMGLSASSCADFLDVQPEGNPNQGGYFQTDKEAGSFTDGWQDVHMP